MWRAITTSTQTLQPEGTFFADKGHRKLLAILLPAALLFFSACEQPIEGIAGDILPPGDAIEMRYTDSLAIRLTTQRLEREDTYRAERQLVGNYVDPEMGRLTATTYTEVLARSGLDFGPAEDLIYDSLVLRLQFDGAYGNISEPLSLQIFEMGDTMPGPEVITNQTSLPYDASQPLAEAVPLQLAGGTGSLRIRMDDELGRDLLFADPEILGDRTRFLELLKGLVITTDPVTFLNKEPGAIYQMVLASDQSQIELYYRQREANSTAFQAKVEPFVIGSSTPRFHQMVRSEVEGILLEEAHSEPDTLTEWEFLQGVNLVQMYVEFPDLEGLGEVAISRAELVLPVGTQFFGGGNRFQPPGELLALLADADGSLVLSEGGDAQSIVDANITYSSSDQSYRILITRYIQSVLSGNDANNGFILQPVAPFYRVNRVILAGMGNAERRPILKVTYSTLPE
jgi:hypothetical protein